jgi:hypothetical protein
MHGRKVMQFPDHFPAVPPFARKTPETKLRRHADACPGGWRGGTGIGNIYMLRAKAVNFTDISPEKVHWETAARNR